MGSRSSRQNKSETVVSTSANLPTEETCTELVEAVLWQNLEIQRLEEHWRQESLLEERRRQEAQKAWVLQQHWEQLHKLEQPMNNLQSQGAIASLAQTSPTQHRVWPGGNEVLLKKLQQPVNNVPLQGAVVPPAEILPSHQRVLLVDNAVPDYTIKWSISEYVKEQHAVSIKVANNVVKLLQNGNTVPFIARYRKHMTHGMEVDKLRKVKSSYERAKLIQERAVTLIREINEQGQMTLALNNLILAIKSLNDLENIHSIFLSTEAILAKKARDAGLENPANLVIKAATIYPFACYAKTMTKGLETEEQVKNGIVRVLADKVNKDECTIEKIKELRSKHEMEIHTIKANDAVPAEPQLRCNNKSNANRYDVYNNFTLSVKHLKPYQVLAINGGETRKILKVEINIPKQFEREFYEYCSNRYGAVLSASPMHKTLMTEAFDYAYNRLIRPSVTIRTRHDITEKAEITTMDNFAQDVKRVLLAPPVWGKTVIGIYPGTEFGCKFAAVSERGDDLETGWIFPHEADIPTAKKDAEETLARLVRKYKCTVLALGDGTASRDTAIFLTDLIQKGAFAPLNVVYQIVYDTGDSDLVSAASIARRLQDPMAELLKMQSKYFGLRTYQYDLPRQKLDLILNDIIMETVSSVGVDVNTASIFALKRVAGLNDVKAKNIVDWRNSFGPFANRNDLRKVKGIGKHAFEQCAGFIRIMPETALGASENSFNRFDETSIHPEYYNVAKSFLEAAKCDIRDMGSNTFVFAVNLLGSDWHVKLAKKFGTTEDVIDLIVSSLTMKKGQDIRDKYNDISVFRKTVTNLADLSIGTFLTGVVRNVMNFGAFVDVGAEVNGLIHKSEMGNNALSVGQRVETKVYKIEKERSRLSLTLVRCA